MAGLTAATMVLDLRVGQRAETMAGSMAAALLNGGCNEGWLDG